MKSDVANASPARVDTGIGRIPELDALRGLAAIGVLCLHTLPRYFFWAWSCVDLFFVLSGFLITSILLANQGAPRVLLSFYARRALRIWPVYYLTFFVVLVIFLAAGWLGNGVTPQIPPGHWLGLVFLQYTDHYLPNAQALQYIWYFAHSWSLAVEEQFYLLWPLTFLALRPGRRSVICIAACALALAIFARAHGAHIHILISRVDGLLFGIALAFLAHGTNAPLYRWPLYRFAMAAVLGIALVAPYVLSHGDSVLFGPPDQRALEVAAFALLYASIVGAAIRASGSILFAPLRHRLLVYLGKLSFAIYMYQVPIGYIGLEMVSRGWINKPTEKVLVWIVTLVLAQLSYVLMEQRILALKRRFPYRKAVGASG